jgi:EAL domain-containing protein (putative c-di-GMP-specific phosphodiesterase class I)/GGDEF domain-containing protein
MRNGIYFKSPLLKVLGFLLCMLVPALVFADVPLELHKGSHSYPLGPYIRYIEDREASLKLEDAQRHFSKPSPKVKMHYQDVFNQGLSNSVFWLNVPFVQAVDDTHMYPDWFLELAYPLLKSVDLYLISEGELVYHERQSDQKKRSDGLGYRNFIFSLDALEQQEFELILRIDTHALVMFPLTVWSAEALAKNSQTTEYWLGFYFGLMAVMAIYSLVVFFIIKDRSYFYFVFYIASTMLFFATFSGLGGSYLAEGAQYWNAHLPLVSAFLAMGFTLKFISSFMELGRLSSALDRTNNLFFGFMLLLSLYAFEKPFSLLSSLSLVVTAIFSFWLFSIAAFSYFKGSRAAGIVFVSFFVLLASATVFSLSLFAGVHIQNFSDLSLYLGSAISVVLLSLGLAGQINEERRQRYQALIRENQAVQSVRRMEEQAAQDAMLDPLSQLPNRAALERFNKSFLDNPNQRKEPLAIVYIQVQGYEQINHSLGFRSGDLFIEKLAGRLNRAAAELEDCVSVPVSGKSALHVVRLDSAAFVLLFRLREEKQKYIDNMQHLLELLNRPVSVHDMSLEAKVRAGMSFLPEHSTNIFTLVRFAQSALELRESEPQLLSIYSSVVGQQAARKLKLINDLRTAIQAGELSLVFQPQIDIREQKIISLEALIRWKHAEYGDVSPDEFIILSEQTGLIKEISDWVIENALDSLLWLIERGVKLRLAINISARNLSEENFPQGLLEKLKKRNLNPSVLSLELTETSLMHDPEQGVRVLKEIHQSGIAIAIDDFGAGYSSLSYIKQLPISELKIDRSFVSQIDSLHSDRVITKSTITLAHEMGARVCAEGVESEECLKILSQFECDLAQGFHIAKPMRKEDLLIWFDERQFYSG